MSALFGRNHLKRAWVYTDGAIRPAQGVSGLAVVVRDEHGRVRYLWSQRAGRLTCNEAEYEAVILALELLRRIRPEEITIHSDSQVVVHQMTGLASVHSPGLRQVHARLRALVTEYRQVTFRHIPRLQNRLADALANEIVDGKAGMHE